MKNAKLFLILLCVLLFMGTPSITFGDWNDGDPYKWVQYPDLSPWGIDIIGTPPYKLADDFECTVTGPLTDFHIWCSWLYDEVNDPHMVDFIIEIYKDIPADESPTGYSMPGERVWDHYFAAYDFIARPYAIDIEEGWMEPPEFYMFPADWTCWQYNFFVDPADTFLQEGTPDRPVIYWVAIQAIPLEFGTWGWKTRNWPEHFNDDAVFLDSDGLWKELRYPPGHELYGYSIDLAFVITGEELDFSDAPEYDPTGLPTSYPTTLANDGARHIIVPGVFLGNLVDPEPDGQPTLPADGDDLDVLYPSLGDDEDGVVFTSPMIPGQPATVDVTASVVGVLYAWVDFNGDGSWAELGDQIFNGTPLNAGLNNLTFNVPNSATPLIATYARFRYLTTALTTFSYNGLGPDGEVEDYEVFIDEEEEELDFSDAPEYDPTGLPTSYPTTLANDGARHIIVPGVFLGNLVDPEPDGQPTLPADGDDLDVLYPSLGDDEDGVTFTSLLIPGQLATVDVVASVPGFLYAWVDFDANFSWAEADNLIFNGTPLNAGLNNLTFNVPNSAAPLTTTYARFRYVTTAVAALSYNGLAQDGDVEDYEVFIEEEEVEKLKFQQLPLDGVVIADIPYYGHDELSTAYRDIDFPEEFIGCYMADDFADLENTPVFKIKWWGSYLENEIMEPIDRFLIAFETDVPADTGVDPPWSHPGELLLSQFVHRSTVDPLQPGEFSEKLVPSPGSPCEQLYEYEAILENPFPQEPDTVYWIKIVALIEDPLVYDRIIRAMTLDPVYPGTLCEFLNLPWAIQQSYGLEMPVTRWGWHNRDYTKMDPYASTPPAVIPGEHIQGYLFPGTMIETPVWHFQDDAVSGEVTINEATPEMPWVYQEWWYEEYYKWYWELCQPNPYDIDGPPEIEEFSKDLAFELWTPTECVKPTASFYSTWALFGKPNCWCYRRNCRGDTDSIATGLGLNKKWVNSIDLAVFNAAYNVIEAPLMGISVGGVPGICADNDRISTGLGVNKKWVNSLDLAIFNSYYNVVEAGVPECDMTNYYFWTN